MRNKFVRATLRAIGVTRDPKNFFIVLFEGRTGSSYLIDKLNKHPNIAAYGEMLDSLRDETDAGRLQLEKIRHNFYLGYRRPIESVGFKTKLTVIGDPTGLGQLIDNEHVRIIHLRRRNLVKLAVSSLAAARLHDRTGQWNLFDENDRLKPFHIGYQEFNDRLQYKISVNQTLDKFIAGLHVPVIRLYYEDMLTDEDSYFRKLYKFLDIPDIACISNIKKNVPDDLKQLVLNVDELKEHYSGTELYKMFDEVLMYDQCH